MGNVIGFRPSRYTTKARIPGELVPDINARLGGEVLDSDGVGTWTVDNSGEFLAVISAGVESKVHLVARDHPTLNDPNNPNHDVKFRGLGGSDVGTERRIVRLSIRYLLNPLKVGLMPREGMIGDVPEGLELPSGVKMAIDQGDASLTWFDMEGVFERKVRALVGEEIFCGKPHAIQTFVTFEGTDEEVAEHIHFFDSNDTETFLSLREHEPENADGSSVFGDKVASIRPSIVRAFVPDLYLSLHKTTTFELLSG